MILSKRSVMLLILMIVLVATALVVMMQKGGRSGSKLQLSPMVTAKPEEKTSETKVHHHSRSPVLELATTRSEIKPPLNVSLLLPFQKMTYLLDVLVHKPWYQSLRAFLSSLPIDSVVYVVSAGEKFLSYLLNWLCTFRLTTSSSLIEILIVTFDADIHKTLLDKGFNSLFISNEDILVPNIKLKYPLLSPVWIKRVTVARIINHLGYHVMMLDLNALVLKDIMELINKMYSSSDIVGSIGWNPGYLRKKWGFSLCMGAVLFRSTTQTEMFWDAMNKLGGKEQDDQNRVNIVLDKLNLNWSQNTTCVQAYTKKSRSQRCTFEGKNSEGLAVTILSQRVICRLGCHTSTIDQYHIWHYNNKQQTQISNGPAWHLRSNWTDVFEKTELKGKQLIDLITATKRR